MISFEKFINSIHSAILSANDALVDKNLELLDKFFEKSADDGSFQETLDEALEATRDVVAKEHKPGKQSFVKALKAMEEVRKALAGDEDRGPGYRRAPLPGSLRPKMTTLQYPQQTANGVVMSDVQVPLIALVPLAMTQISEVKLRSELEIQIGEDHELLVSFPMMPSEPAIKPTEQTPKAGSVATLEICLTPHAGTEGLRKIVEGYEKMLRAQIPN